MSRESRQKGGRDESDSTNARPTQMDVLPTQPPQVRGHLNGSKADGFCFDNRSRCGAPMLDPVVSVRGARQAPTSCIHIAAQLYERLAKESRILWRSRTCPSLRCSRWRLKTKMPMSSPAYNVGPRRLRCDQIHRESAPLGNGLLSVREWHESAAVIQFKFESGGVFSRPFAHFDAGDQT